MKIYTKGGDKGRTATYGGPRVSKSDPLMHCLGALDQANVWLGQMRTDLNDNHVWQSRLMGIQSNLMEAMSEIAALPNKEAQPRIAESAVTELETWIDEIEDNLQEASQYFLLPGGNNLNIAAHHARCTVREGERHLSALIEQYKINGPLLAYINRLSDLMFSLSRLFLEEAGLPEAKWKLFIKPSSR